MTDPWYALMWGGLALAGVSAAALIALVWWWDAETPPIGDLTWEGDECDCEACTGAPTELPEGLVCRREATP